MRRLFSLALAIALVGGGLTLASAQAEEPSPGPGELVISVLDFPATVTAPTADLVVGLSPAVVPDEIAWEVRRSTGDGVVGSGVFQGPFSAGPDGVGILLPFVAPWRLAEGNYELRLSASAVTEDAGTVSGAVARPFRYDPYPVAISVKQQLTTFYPYSDGYRDNLALDVTVNSSRTVEIALSVRNQAGKQVAGALNVIGGNSTGGVSWTGRTNRGTPVAPGTYSLEVTAREYDGDSVTWNGAVVVSGKRLVTKASSFTISAAASLSGKPYVGPCSKLARRAKGGLGFYSQTKCKGSLKRSVVSVYHGAYLPKAFEGRYRSVQVTLNGAPANKARNNYINLGYAGPNRTELAKLKSLRGKGGHRGKTAPASVIFDRTKDRPYLIWWAGLTAGSRFNVNSYKVTTTYQVLR
ncbi:hypothetical protein ACLM5J_09850 [Nocardioides sp. Bht2]|uniref:hypothetical protein n=1 Tax=Nocardioides sp. Bht2 TaxID=3392297 RepID=UPI0039B3A8AA